MTKKIIKIIILIITIFFNLFIVFNMNILNATNIFKINKVLMSLKVNDVNARKGPGSEFPIIYHYKLKGMPITVLGEFDNWYKAEDKDGDVIWFAKHLVSKTKTVIVIQNLAYLYSNPNINKSYIKLKLEKNVVLKLIKCKEDRCKVKVNKIKGWVNKSDIWGYEI